MLHRMFFWLFHRMLCRMFYDSGRSSIVSPAVLDLTAKWLASPECSKDARDAKAASCTTPGWTAPTRSRPSPTVCAASTVQERIAMLKEAHGAELAAAEQPSSAVTKTEVFLGGFPPAVKRRPPSRPLPTVRTVDTVRPSVRRSLTKARPMYVQTMPMPPRKATHRRSANERLCL